MNYIRNSCLKGFHWEGQFEDAPISVQYSNMTHFSADAIIRDITQNRFDDPKELAIAEELTRYVEDQFVVWSDPMKYTTQNYDPSIWNLPCGLEQYNWYVPIDSSTAVIMDAFRCMHSATNKPLYLAKTKALADYLDEL